MKQSIITLLLLFSLFGQIVAQAPQFINFQAVARDNSGNPIINQGNIQVTFTIQDGNQSIYSETQNANTDACGMFNLKIGAGNGSPISFSQIDWTNGTKFLEVKVNNSIIGTQQLVSVPYALYAEKTNIQAGNGLSITGTEISAKNTSPIWNADKLQGNNVSSQPPLLNQILQWNGKMWVPATLPPQTGSNSQTLIYTADGF